MKPFWYLSTSFFVPSEKKLFGCSRSDACITCVFRYHNVHTSYGTPSHHALWPVITSIVAICIKEIRRYSLIKASTLGMSSPVRDVDERWGQLSSAIFVLSILPTRTIFIDSSCMLHTAPISSDGLLQVWQKAYSGMVHSLNLVYIRLTSLLPATRLNDCSRLTTSHPGVASYLLFLPRNFKVTFTFWFAFVK